MYFLKNYVWFFLIFRYALHPCKTYHACLPQIHLILSREGLQGRYFSGGVCVWCVKIMWPNPSAVAHVESAKRYSELSSELSRELAVFVWPLSIKWSERKCKKIFSHIKRKRRLKNHRPCKSSQPTINCIRGTVYRLCNEALRFI